MTFALRKLKEGMARNCRLIDEWVQERYTYIGKEPYGL